MSSIYHERQDGVMVHDAIYHERQDGVTMHDAILIVAQSRLQDRYMEAARRALLAEASAAAPSRSTLAIRIGHLFVWIGERIEGIRYAPVTTLSANHSSR